MARAAKKSGKSVATSKATPASSSRAKAAPAKAARKKASAAKPARAKATPAKATPTKAAPAKAVPAKAAPAKATRTKAAPSKAASVKAAQTKVAPAAKPAAKTPAPAPTTRITPVARPKPPAATRRITPPTRIATTASPSPSAPTTRITPRSRPRKAAAVTTSRIKADGALTTRSAATTTRIKATSSTSTPRTPKPGGVRGEGGAPRRGHAGAPARKPTSAEVVESIVESLVEATDAVPLIIGGETSAELARRSLTARERALRSSPVVEILDDPYPMGALRRFLDSVKGSATPQQAQIALGSAQLMLVDFEREHRGGDEVKALVDLVLGHWEDFGERRKGFHAQEFLRNALAAIGVDRERIAQLEALIPEHATSELLFNLACAHAVARDKVAMLRAVERALEAGASATAFRRDPDFAPYTNDPDLALLLARAEIPPIPVHVEPYLPGVRDALDSLVSTLKEFGESIELRPPVRLDAILDAERAGRISLPNDYRALLTITNGMRLWEHEFFSVGDYRESTRLALRARQYLESNLAVPGLVECVPLASWGQPGDWLLYDPRGRLRAGQPGYVLIAEGAEIPVEDLVTALAHMENLAREVLGTN